MDQSSTVYTNAAYTNRVYCLVTSADASGSNTYRKYTTTFTDLMNAQSGALNLTCDASSDTPTITVGVTNPETFTPGTEL